MNIISFSSDILDKIKRFIRKNPNFPFFVDSYNKVLNSHQNYNQIVSDYQPLVIIKTFPFFLTSLCVISIKLVSLTLSI